MRWVVDTRCKHCRKHEKTSPEKTRKRRHYQRDSPGTSIANETLEFPLYAYHSLNGVSEARIEHK